MRRADKAAPVAAAITETERRRREFKLAAARVYNAVAFDVWRERCPSKAEFVDVIADQMCRDTTGLSAEDQAAWHALSAAARRRIILEVGP